ncbi:MAG TPA: CsbD family protein [Blastocatellia bacterium]|nr:CsbD family protein [Blastocatellia bacterium]
MATQKGSFSEEVSAMGERAKGAVKDATGAMTGNRSLEREGEYENQQGRARQESNTWLTGTFNDRESAERAYNSMIDRGYDHDDVNLLMSDDTRKKYFADDDTELGNKAMEGAGVGGAIGGVAGGIIGALAAIGTNAIVPGLGIVVAGPLLAGLAGAGAGGATGGIIGALIGAGIPEDRAKLYESDIKNGGIVMGVNPRSDEDASYFEQEWKGYNGRNIYR